MAPHNQQRPTFWISHQNTRVEEWARQLLSPKAQDVPVPSWYTTYLKTQNVIKAKEATLDTSPSSSSSPASARYNLRSSKSRLSPPLSTIHLRQPVPSKWATKGPQKKKSSSSCNRNQPGSQTRYNLRSTPRQVIKSKTTTAVNKAQKRP